MKPVIEDRDKVNAQRAKEVKTCNKCGFTGQKGKYFARTSVKGLYQYSHCKKGQQAATRAWRYGMTVDEMNALLESSTHCGVCKGEFTDNRKVIDHCHSTGKVRGVLCDPCNTTLGHLEKTEDSLMNYIKYLSKHSYDEIIREIIKNPS